MKRDDLLAASRASHLRLIANCDDSQEQASAEKNVVEIRTVMDTRKSTSNPKGVPKSGRVWKRLKTKRYSTIRVDKPLKSSWQSKIAKRDDQKALKEFSKQIQEEKAEKAKAQRLNTEEKKKRKLENERKAEVVQPVKSTSKIKRMRKKQLRTIEKR